MNKQWHDVSWEIINKYKKTDIFTYKGTTPTLFQLPKPKVIFNIFETDLSNNQNYFQAMVKALEELGSSALPESEAGDADIVTYLKSTFNDDTTIIVANERWALDIESDEKRLYFMKSNFPYEQFLQLLVKEPGNCFLLPINIKGAHYCGLMIQLKKIINEDEKVTIKLEWHYINPTASHSKITGEDKQAFEEISTAFSYLNKVIIPQLCSLSFDGRIHDKMTEHKLEFAKKDVPKEFYGKSVVIKPMHINRSCIQQFSNCDCGFIVAQSLVDMAKGDDLAIPSFKSAPEKCIRMIARTRAVFAGSDEKTIRAQYFLRFAKALTENVHYSVPLCQWIFKLDIENYKSQGSIYSFLHCLRMVVLNIRLGKEGFKTIFGKTPCDLANNFIQANVFMKSVSTSDLAKYSNWLLTPIFEEYGGVIFKLNTNREPSSDLKKSTDFHY